MKFWIFNSKNTSKLFRALARLVDYFTMFLVAGTVSMYLPWFIETYYYFIFALAVPLLWIPIEALLISLWGTTPGKALFGIKIFDAKGKKLPYWKSLKQAAFLSPRPGLVRQISLSFRRRVAAIAIILGCSIASMFGNTLASWTLGFENGISTKGWTQYAYDDAGFRVHFPHDPKEESKQLDIPKSDQVLNYQELKATQNKKVHYSVSYMDLPRKWKIAGASRLLKGALDLMVKHMPGTSVIEKKFTTHQNYRAMDFHLMQGEEEVRGRLIMVGMTLYKVTITYPPELAQELQDNPFLESFDLSQNG